MSATRTMSLNAFLMATGHHVAAWRDPASRADGGLDFEHYRQLARTAQRGCLDAIFLSDTLAMLPGNLGAVSRMARTEHFEPLTLLGALAAVTERIGLVATVTTSYNDPAAVARSFASLERLSGARSGWNLVTSSNAQEAPNFGRAQHFDHAARYQRAQAFLAEVRKYWQREGVAPVQVLAGASPAGCAFAAAHAEVVFTAQPDLVAAQAFYRDLKARASAAGRDPAQVKVMPGVLPIVAATHDEAWAKYEALQARVLPEVGLSLLGDIAGGTDLSTADLDGPLPALPSTESGVSRRELLINVARAEGLSIRQLYLRMATARGHWVVIGEPGEVADQLEHWFRSEAADGFNVMPATLPGGLDDFVDTVVPLLQARGLFRQRYQGTTLREHLGLSAPPSHPYPQEAGRHG
ncbi:LLM class flavin-dependent oxidoreductase [Pseudomonas typographi]|uniref:LLM class flavin-dependent oxidoreductase n=1 Tax=Pseudomonas typographi TaxID=2715964 RepID=A0ABR7YWX0_9PSED|nr:LLM class flavin-dependent oxidoreductase [Pseudomonas typographi]MBD1552623.1 LLM class flavin-dependent oxidoreductase [Pseudomonas typographi]MBD1586204.1 LLM class flavin-dependent oxidoreductase [Pseudomonas typographi]MBD1597675.1 LLM class flavin-dependent oxidoreductase [Pseudomonas typographi]